MKKLLIIIGIVLVGLICVSPSAMSQCDKDLTIYGFGSAPAGSNSFGKIVASAGDVDNDGYPDILVAAPQYYFGLGGTVTVFSGPTGDSIRTYYQNPNTVYSAGSFGDYNNDEYDDILVNGVVYSGLNGDTLFNFGNTNRKGISVGDANGDGIHDLAVPDYGYSSLLGRVDLLSGATGDTLQSWIGSGAGGRFGFSVAAAGDFDNDGYADVVIGQPVVDVNGTDRGRAFVYSGLDGSQLFVRLGEAAGQQFGYNVAGAGDLDNDGYADILVAGQSENALSAPLKVWAFSGHDDSLLYTVPAGNYMDKFGYSMASVGDISNDGCDDFIVGAFRYASNRGNAYLFSGKDGTLFYETYDRFGQNEQQGYSVAGVGDTDGDGSPDFVVGVPYGDDPDNPSQNNYFRGAARIYRCSFPSWECQRYVDFDWDLWSNVCDNCKWFANLDQADEDSDGIGDMCEDSAITYVGARSILFGKARYEYPGVYPQLALYNVAEAGYTYLTMTPLNEATPGFREIPWLGPMKYTFTSDALILDSLEVQLLYLDTSLSTAEEEALQLFQKIDGYWRNITSQAAEPIFNRVRGRTTALGEFAIGSCEATPDIDADGIGDLCDNCPLGYNPFQEDADSNGVGDICEASQTLPAGASGTANLIAAGETVNISFAMIDQEGDVNLSVVGNGPASGETFTLFPADPPTYYIISTDALYSGDISITLSYDDAAMSVEEEAMMALWHYEGNAWVNITQELNTVSNYVVGLTSSLSPFALGFGPLPTDVGDVIPSELPQSFTLMQNYPNPFNPQTVVEYSVSSRSRVSIEVFNIVGQKVRTLVDEDKSAGEYRVIWDGADSDGQKVSSGVYLYRFKAGTFVDTKKMLLLK